MPAKLADLKETRSIKLSELRAIASKEAAEETLSDNERKRFDELEAELRKVDDQIRRAETIAEMERRATATPVGTDQGAAPDLTKYSVARALRGAMSGKLDGVEGEVHTELSRGREMRGNVMIPTTILLGERRAQTVDSGPAGGFLVPQQIAAVADHFRPALKVESMGATVLRDLTGDLELPNLAASGSAKWIGETQAATRTSATFEKTNMSPHTVAGEYELSRRFMLQTGPAIEDLLRRDLGILLATALDAAAIKRRQTVDATNSPTGILDNTDVEVVNYTNIGDTASDLIAALELDDVTGTLGFLTNPTVMSIARKFKDGNGQYVPLNVLFRDTRYETSTQVPNTLGAGSNKSAFIVGVWSELVVGYWSGVDILVNPYHSDVASKGGALIHAFLDADIAIRHAKAFAYALI